MINRSLTNMPALNTNDMLYNRFYTGRAEGGCIHHPWVYYGDIYTPYTPLNDSWQGYSTPN